MKRWHVLLISVAALPLIAADGCGSGTGGSAAGTTTTKTFTVGQAMVDSDGRSVTVLSFKRKYSTGNQFDKPDAGKELVLVTFGLSNGSKSEWSLPLYELNVVDANGQKYTSGITTGQDRVDSLVAGGKAPKVKQIYEVPTGSALDVTWVPNMFEKTVFQTALK
jgi:hypothetical protein